MIQTVNITQVSITDKKRDGSDLITKKGKKFWKVGIKTEEYGDRWLNGLAFSTDDDIYLLKQGDTISVSVDENEYGLNFKMPDEDDIADVRMVKLEGRVEQVERDIEELKVLYSTK